MTDENATDDRPETGRGTDGPADRGSDDPAPDRGVDGPADRGSDDSRREGDPVDPELSPGNAAVEPTPDGGAGTTDRVRNADAPDVSKTRTLLLWVALFVLSLLAVVALLQFYLNASAAINRWVAPEYRRIMQAVFNLVVLLLSGIGIAAVVRKLGE